MARGPLRPADRAAPDGADADRGSGRMQRVRIGVIGLAGVFLLTMLATAIYSLLGEDSPPGAPATNIAASADTNAASAPKEPLAELGVTPGYVPPAGNAAAPVPARNAAPAAPPPRH